jgi:hypothetical protein
MEMTTSYSDIGTKTPSPPPRFAGSSQVRFIWSHKKNGRPAKIVRIDFRTESGCICSVNSDNICRQELDGAPPGEAPSSGHSRVWTLDPDSRPFLFLNTPSNLLQKHQSDCGWCKGRDMDASDMRNIGRTELRFRFDETSRGCISSPFPRSLLKNHNGPRSLTDNVLRANARIVRLGQDKRNAVQFPQS